MVNEQILFLFIEIEIFLINFPHAGNIRISKTLVGLRSQSMIDMKVNIWTPEKQNSNTSHESETQHRDKSFWDIDFQEFICRPRKNAL